LARATLALLEKERTSSKTPLVKVKIPEILKITTSKNNYFCIFCFIKKNKLNIDEIKHNNF